MLGCNARRIKRRIVHGDVRSKMNTWCSEEDASVIAAALQIILIKASFDLFVFLPIANRVANHVSRITSRLRSPQASPGVSRCAYSSARRSGASRAGGRRSYERVAVAHGG